MSNSISGFAQTVLAAASEASQLLAPNWKAIESIYMQYKPVVATIGQTVNVVIPTDPTNSVADQGAGDVNLTDVGFSTTPIVFNKHPSFGFVIKDYEQYNAASNIREDFMDAALKGIKSNINAAICALFTTGNFPTNSAISTTNHLVTTNQFLSGFAVLSDQFVPVIDDPANMSLLLGSLPYTAVIGDANWTNSFIAGERTTEAVRPTGVMPTAFGMQAKLDQQMPVSGTVGSRTFTGAYLHRHAVACVSRPLPKPDGKVVDFTYVDFHGISIRVSVGYNQYPKQGFIVTVDAGYGLKVVRDNMCQLYTIAE